MQNSLKQIWQVLTPSWLSGLVVTVLCLVGVIGTLIVSNYQGSRLQQQLFEARGSGPLPLRSDFQTITDNLAHNQVVSNLPLFLFWAVLGIIVYLAATNLWNVLGSAEELREELNYVNAPKRHLVQNVVVHLAARLVVLAAWLAYVQLFLKVLLPYVLDAAHIAAVDLLSLSGIGYTLLAFAVAWVALQAHVVFLRLVFLRSRLWGDEPELD